MFDRNTARRDRIEEQEAAAYEEAFDRIEARLIAEEIADGADAGYRPSGATVHALVMKELERRKQDD